MMLKEFVERTGFEPTPAEYAKIEQAYMNFYGDKNAFCEAFVKGNGEQAIYNARALEIEKLQSQLADLQKEMEQQTRTYEAKTTVLQAELDKELEWQPYSEMGTNLLQTAYEKLAGQSDTKVFEPEDAVDFISRACGFDPTKIEINNTVKTYEINKHRRVRLAQSFIREALYNATDWNYIHFICAGREYEYINGELNFCER